MVHADVIGVEAGSVKLGRPQSAGLLVGERDRRFVVADTFGQGQRPGARAIERLLFLLRELGAAQYRACAVDQQPAQVEVAALGDAAESSGVAAGVFTRRQSE